MTLQEIRERAASALGISTFNPMQEAVSASGARSLLLIAPTGSGKTLAFATALLQRLGKPAQRVMAVVIAPSRELVMQIHSVIRPLAQGYKTVALYGGNAFSAESASIAGGVPQIVVATPGRLLDHINRRTIDVESAEALVVDEYDKTLELGFHDEVRRIVARLKRIRFTALTSATELAEMPRFMPVAGVETIDAGNIDAPRLMVMEVPSPARDKLDTLAALLRHAQGQTMVFVNHRESAERVVDSLAKRHIPAVLYHGGLEQREREIAVATFRAGAARVMVATDLAARGLDIAGVDNVVHYHMPTSEQAWTHRNGRTARAGAAGDVYVITGPDEPVPDFVVVHHPFYPDMTAATPVAAEWRMLYINAGKRQKISRGDIAGFVMKQCGVPAAQVGAITVGLDYALVAVAPHSVATVTEAARSARLKNKRVRITEL